MSGAGTGGGSQPQTPNQPWSGQSQQAGTSSVQATPGSAPPPVPGITPGVQNTPFRGPSNPISGWSGMSPQQATNPNDMSNGMPGVNAQTGTGSYIGAPGYMTGPPPMPTGYGLGPNQMPQQQGQPGQGGFVPPTLGTGGR